MPQNQRKRSRERLDFAECLKSCKFADKPTIIHVMEKPITIKDIAKTRVIHLHSFQSFIGQLGNKERNQGAGYQDCCRTELSSEHAGKRVGHKEKLYYRNRCA